MCIWERRLTGIHQVHSGKTHRLAHRSKWLARRNTLILGGVYGSVSTSGICRCVRLGCERILAQSPGFADRGDAVRRPPQEGTGNLARGDFALERGTHRLPDTKPPAEAGVKSRVLEALPVFPHRHPPDAAPPPVQQPEKIRRAISHPVMSFAVAGSSCADRQGSA